MIFRLVCSRRQQYRYARRAEAGVTVRAGGSGPPAPRGTSTKGARERPRSRWPWTPRPRAAGAGAGAAGEASAETARQALLLASQALGTNAERVREAREERDAREGAPLGPR